MKFKSVLPQLSHDVCELERISCFSKSLHSERGFPGILASRLLQGQAELTKAMWTNHSTQGLTVHIFRHDFPIKNMHVTYLCLVNLYWVCEIRNWRGLVQRRISILHVLHGTHLLCYIQIISNIPVEENLFILKRFRSLRISYNVFWLHSLHSPNSSQIYTVFPIHPTSGPPFLYPSSPISA